MSQMGVNPSPPRVSGRASNNIYTALMFIAAAALLFGIIFVAVRANQLFGTINPFEVVKP